jgi:hypothetical protein
VQDVALVGPPDAIRAQLPAWRATAVTTLLVQTDPRSLAAVAELLGDDGGSSGEPAHPGSGDGAQPAGGDEISPGR